MRKKIKMMMLLFLAGMLIVFAFTANKHTFLLDSFDEKQSEIESVNKKEKTETEEIILWYSWELPMSQKHLKKLTDEYNHSQNKVKIIIKYIPSEDFKKELALNIANQTAPDIALIDSCDFQFFFQIQKFADLTDLVPELSNYMDKAMKPCEVDGRYYGVPFGVNCTVMYYNKKMLQEAQCEVPKTWQEFYDTVIKLKQTQDYYGFAITALKSEGAMYQFLPILWSMGGDVFELNSLQSKNAFEMLINLQQQGALTKQSINLTGRDIANLFANENIAIMFNSGENIGLIRQNNPELDFDITYIPTNTRQITTCGGEIFGVLEGANEEGAADFLNYISDKERMASYMDSFYILAPREDVMTGQYPDDDVIRKQIDIYKTAELRRISSKWPQISEIVSNLIENVIIEEKNINDILPEASAQISNLGEE